MKSTKINLYIELQHLLNIEGLSEKDILWIGTKEKRFYPPDARKIFGFEFDWQTDDWYNDILSKIYIVGGNWMITYNWTTDDDYGWAPELIIDRIPSLPAQLAEVKCIRDMIDTKREVDKEA